MANPQHVIRFTPTDGRRSLAVPLDGIRYIFTADPEHKGALSCEIRDDAHRERVKALLGLDEEPAAEAEKPEKGKPKQKAA